MARGELQRLKEKHSGPQSDSMFAAEFVKLAKRHGISPMDLIRFGLTKNPPDQRRIIAILNELDPEANARPLD